MSVKLYYYGGRGLAEPIRIILTYGGLEFEDIRVPIVGFPTPLPVEIKEKCTWGQVPLIEFEGKKLAQSLAITRYFAKKFKLVGSDDFEAAQCDEYVDTCRELMQLWVPLVIVKDDERDQKMQEILKTADEKYLIKFNSLVEKNGGRRLVGKNLTWADIYLAHVINNVENLKGVEILSHYPALRSLSDAVFKDEPKIKEWIENRPKSDY